MRVKTTTTRITMQLDGDNSIMKIRGQRFWEPLEGVHVCEVGEVLTLCGFEDAQILSMGVVKRISIRKKHY
jgi:hypothetical protein